MGVGLEVESGKAALPAATWRRIQGEDCITPSASLPNLAHHTIQQNAYILRVRQGPLRARGFVMPGEYAEAARPGPESNAASQAEAPTGDHEEEETAMPSPRPNHQTGPSPQRRHVAPARTTGQPSPMPTHQPPNAKKRQRMTEQARARAGQGQGQGSPGRQTATPPTRARARGGDKGGRATEVVAEDGAGPAARQTRGARGRRRPPESGK